MNKRSVKKKRPAKASRSPVVRKSSTRAAAPRKLASRQVTKKAEPARAAKASSAAKKSNLSKISAVAKASGIKASGIKASAVLTISDVVRLSDAEKIVSRDIATVTVAQVTALSAPLRTHRFRVGQTVSYTSSPISRPGASGSYQVVRLLPSDGDDYQYRIKNPGEAFERVAKESQLELEH
jgi:hypothetical protein